METARAYWIRSMEKTARPVLEAMAEGRLRERMPLRHHPAADPGRLATASLEAAGRLLSGIAPWLACEGLAGKEESLRADFAEMALRGVVAGVDPNHPDYWNFDTHQQALVDAAFLAQALLRAPAVLWDPLDGEAKTRALNAFRCLRDRAPAFNNWLLFSACTEAFLAKVGTDWDPMRVDYAIRQHEQWYLGDGTYGDGPVFHCDYYNSYVIQPMLQEVLEVVAPLDGRWQPFVEPARSRLRRYAAIQERMIHIDGSWPVTGRSICYRTGAFHALSFAAWKDLLPEGMEPAAARCALTAAIERGLYPEINYDADGWLQIGLNGPQPSLGEHYITTGSLYLAAFVFPVLGLSAGHPFWKDPDRPWTAKRVWELGEDLPPDHAG
jgi:hypothetical protein